MTEQFGLSKREVEILELVATGLTNREIAQKLTISPNTVKVHLSNIFEKAGVTSRTEAALYGIEQGIIDIPGAESVTPGKSIGRDVLRKYKWVWIGVGFIIVAVLATLSFNGLFAKQDPDPAVTADVSERWQELTPLPEARSGMAAVAYDDMLIVFGGKGPDAVSGGVFRYLPESAAWEQLNDKPTPVYDVRAVLIGERIYVPGGRTDDSKPSDILEIYDPRRDAWEVGSPLPQAVSAYALAAFEGKLYMFGGWDGNQALGSVFIYDPIADAWLTGADMSSPAYDLGAVAMTDKIIVLGGRNLDEVKKDAQAYYPSRDVNQEDPWEDFVDLPQSRFGFGAAGVFDAIYVLGGWSGEEDGGGLNGLMMAEGEWVEFPTNYAYGGRQIDLVPLGSLLYVLDPSTPLMETRVWTYQAFYYSIYIPYMP